MGTLSSKNSKAQKGTRTSKRLTKPIQGTNFSLQEAEFHNYWLESRRDVSKAFENLTVRVTNQLTRLKQVEAFDDIFSFPLDSLELSSVSDKQLAKIFLTAPTIHEFGGVKICKTV
jgi:hypothetical protein